MFLLFAALAAAGALWFQLMVSETSPSEALPVDRIAA
jgi:hypothetical protein